MNKTFNKTQIYNFIHLVQGALEEETVPCLEKPDWGMLFRLAKAHNVVSMGYEGMERMPAEVKPEDELRKRWKYETDQCTYHCMYQQAALEELMEAFEKRQIPVILLKGAVLRDFYPRADLRSMADMDILVKIEDIEQVRQTVAELGYKTEYVDSRNEDVYIRDGFVTLEVHRELFWKQAAWNEYFHHVWERTEKVAGYEWVQVMNPADFYFHLLGHMIHHMYNGGIGIKAFLDTRIFKEHYREALDTEEVREVLRKFQLEKLDNNLSRLFDSWRNEEMSDPFTDEWTRFIVNCGAYGEVGNFIILNPALQNWQKSGQRKYKGIYILRRLFPSYEEMRTMYPKMKKYSYLYYAVKRIFKNGIMRFSIIKREYDTVKSLEDSKITQLYELYDRIGIPPV